LTEHLLDLVIWQGQWQLIILIFLSALHVSIINDEKIINHKNLINCRDLAFQKRPGTT
jgi:hypothetical protein